MTDVGDGMYRYQVGEMFSADRDRWPQGPHLWMDEDGIRLGVFLTRPHPREVAAIQTGKARFAWTEQGPLGFLLFKFGDLPWNDAPFNPTRLTTPFGMEPTDRGTHRSVFTFMVHADTGVIAVMRMFSWPAYFLNHVIASVRRIDAAACPGPEADAAQHAFYRQYPNGPSLYRLVRDLPPEAVCLGGQRDDKPH